MRKAIHVLTGLILLIVLTGQAAFIYYAIHFDFTLWERSTDVLAASPQWAVLAGIALFAVTVIYLVSGIPRRLEEQYITYKSDGGEVSISVKAVNDLLSRLDGEFADIVSLKSSLRPRGGSMDVDFDIKVKAGALIPELTRLLQDRVRESIQDNLGLADIRNVRVMVRDIVGAVPQNDKIRDELSE